MTQHNCKVGKKHTFIHSPDYDVPFIISENDLLLIPNGEIINIHSIRPRNEIPFGINKEYLYKSIRVYDEHYNFHFLNELERETCSFCQGEGYDQYSVRQNECPRCKGKTYYFKVIGS